MVRRATPCVRTVFTRVRSPLGPLYLVGEVDDGALVLTNVGFDTLPFPAADDAKKDAGAFAQVRAELDAYFSGARTRFDLVLRPHGTAFQRAVWRALTKIPYGTTTTYGAIANAIGRPRAVRAVGAAIGHNPLPIVVPCHRVIGRDGSLTGYTGGLDKKRVLLGIETRAAASAPRRPGARAGRAQTHLRQG